MIIKFLTQKCIGYSDDLKQSHFRHEVLLANGHKEIRYNTYTHHDNGYTTSGEYTVNKPFVAVDA